ncbi:thioredoxin family protein [Nostoc sp. TCL26-01]|uniref:thioredoxin family protein n=1 Tax=Nostoc sp. TCL26-01 TaxID=2576904 RepID=UPI0015B9B6BD|nr:thioredoxin family protein [Nostoc sp. TCL26-01]QLE54926.1 thioredoxin family protein [Nostoc sp. TCL26-01]
MIRLETIDTPVGSYAPDFELPGIDNQVHHLRRYLENFRAVGVVSMCNYCPYVNFYLDRLKNIQAEFAHQRFTLIGMNASDFSERTGSSLASMQAFAQEKGLNFPYLWDSTQEVSRSFGAIKTPTAFLIDTHGILRYRGQIDNHPQKSSFLGENYLRNAIAALFKGEDILVPETEPVGTSIIWRI